LNEADIQELVKLVQSELRASGMSELAEPERYADFAEEAGEHRRLPPVDLLVAMLKGFERQVTLEDGDLVRNSLRRIGELTTDETAPRFAYVLPTPEADEPSDLPFETRLKRAREQNQLDELHEIPSQEVLRGQVRSFIGELFQSLDSDGADE
jgi:hypothetical protein